MAIRVLSGIIFANTALVGDNSVTISFNPHRRTSGGTEVGEMQEVGASGDFAGRPCKHVALREIEVLTRDTAFTDRATFTIFDDVDADRLVVRWRGREGGIINEISYMVIGEVLPPREEPADRDDLTPNPVRPGDRGRGRGDGDSTENDGRS